MASDGRSEQVDPVASQSGQHTLAPRLKVALVMTALAAALPIIALLVRSNAPTTTEIGSGFVDDFNRSDLGYNYCSTGGYWRIADGRLLSPGAKNNPLWLKAALPADVQVEFDAGSASPEGDVRAEIFGDGYDHDSGYELVFGGLGNGVTTIARLDERGVSVPAMMPNPLPNDGLVRVERRDMRVEPGRTYHWTIRRQGGTLSWALDGQPVMEIIDPQPLRGRGHDRFAFNTWDTDVTYDNLKITPL
jgi:hypothetical protein